MNEAERSAAAMLERPLTLCEKVAWVVVRQ